VRAVLVTSSGAADVLQVTEVDRPSPGAGQVLVRVAVAGVNYMDVYQRSGAVSLPTPFVAGVEGVGTVVEVGDGVDDLPIGQRVGWLRGARSSPWGSGRRWRSGWSPAPDSMRSATRLHTSGSAPPMRRLASFTGPSSPASSGSPCGERPMPTTSQAGAARSVLAASGSGWDSDSP
jgi:hypothetical protein